MNVQVGSEERGIQTMKLGQEIDDFVEIGLSLVDNSIERHCLGSRTPGLVQDADGGLSITLSAQPPAQAGVNWLPAPPEPFYVALRLYQPGPVHLERRFIYPPIQRLG